MQIGIGTKIIIALMVVSLLPLAFAELLSIASILDSVEKGTDAAVVQVAGEREIAFGGYLDRIRARAQDFASDGYIISGTEAAENGSAAPGGLDDYLTRKTRQLDGPLAGAFVVDRSGIIIASTNSSEIGKDESRDEYVTKGRAGAFSSFLSGGFFHFGLRQGLVGSAPITDGNGSALGVIVLMFDTSEVKQLVTSFPAASPNAQGVPPYGTEFRTYLVDAEGSLIAHPGDNTEYPAEMDTLPVRACFNGTGGVVGRYAGYNGEEVIGASRCLPDNGVVLITEVSVGEIFAPVDTLYFDLGFATLFFISFIILFGLVLASSITRPIKELTEVIGRISTGDLGAQMSPRLLQSEDEVGELARAFERTLVSLKMAMKQSAPELKRRLEENGGSPETPARGKGKAGMTAQGRGRGGKA